LAAQSNGSRTRFFAINPGLVIGTDADVFSPERRQILARQGLSTVSLEQVLSTIEYSITNEASSSGHSQIIIGLDPALLLKHDAAVNSRIYTDMLYTVDATNNDNDLQTKGSLNQRMETASSREESHDIVLMALQEKLSELIAVDLTDLRTNISISDFGLDSLVAIELKNWIGRSFKLALQTSEILDAASLSVLADKIIDKR
jgi:acyl carrier protein